MSDNDLMSELGELGIVPKGQGKAEEADTPLPDTRGEVETTGEAVPAKAADPVAAAEAALAKLKADTAEAKKKEKAAKAKATREANKSRQPAAAADKASAQTTLDSAGGLVAVVALAKAEGLKVTITVEG